MTKSIQVARYVAKNIIPDLQEKLTVDGIDVSSALTALAVNAAGGNESLYEGTGRTGHVGSLKRVGNEAKERYGTDEFQITDLGALKSFNGRGVKVKVHRNPRHTIFQEPEVHGMLNALYLESPYCREGEYTNLIDTTRGLLMLQVLEEQLGGTYDETQGKFFEHKGSSYLYTLVKDYEAEPDLCAAHLLADAEKAGIIG